MNRMTMMALAVALPLLGGSHLTADDKEDAIQKELKALEGTWELVAAVLNGNKTIFPREEKRRVTFKGDRYTTEFGGKPSTEKGTHKLDPTRTPRAIDLVPADGPTKIQARLGVYELKGDELRLCLSDPGTGRPTGFTSKKGSGHALYTYKRIKP